MLAGRIRLTCTICETTVMPIRENNLFQIASRFKKELHDADAERVPDEEFLRVKAKVAEQLRLLLSMKELGVDEFKLFSQARYQLLAFESWNPPEDWNFPDHALPYMSEAKQKAARFNGVCIGGATNIGTLFYVWFYDFEDSDSDALSVHVFFHCC
jgi:hypothetical protein